MSVIVLRLASCVALAVAMTGCGGDDGSTGDAGTGTTMDGSTGGGGDGSTDRDGGGGPGGDDGGGMVGIPECNLGMDGEPCTMDDSCNWSIMCSEGRCDCPFGTWTCSAVDTCTTGPGCPAPQDTSCGDPCDAAATGCLCSCGGGGPNFTACECVGGRFECNLAC